MFIHRKVTWKISAWFTQTFESLTSSSRHFECNIFGQAKSAAEAWKTAIYLHTERHCQFTRLAISCSARSSHECKHQAYRGGVWQEETFHRASDTKVRRNVKAVSNIMRMLQAYSFQAFDLCSDRQRVLPQCHQPYSLGQGGKQKKTALGWKTENGYFPSKY